MATRFPLLGSRGASLVSGPSGWELTIRDGLGAVESVVLGFHVLTPAALAAALCVPESAIRFLADAIELTH